jgi:hypothetical protein
MQTLHDSVVDRALDEIEAGLHDCGTHGVARLAALGVVALGDAVSVRSHYRALAVLRATKGGDTR